MSQVLIFAPIHVVGVLLALAGGLRDRPILACTLGFPLGLAATLTCLLALLVAKIPLGYPAVIVALLAPSMIVLKRLKNNPPTKPALVLIAIYTVVFTLTVLLATRLQAAMTFDSHTFVILGRTFANEGLSIEILNQLRSWGVFVALEQSLVVVLPNDYIYALAPTFALSFVSSFSLMLWYSFNPTNRHNRWVAAGFIALVVVAISTISMFAYNFIYIHTNFGAAIYLFLFVSLFWMAETQKRPQILPLAALSLLAFCLHRVETPAIAALFLVLTVPYSKLPRKDIGVLLATVIVPISLWYIYLGLHPTNESEYFLTSTRIFIVVASLSLASLHWMLSEKPLIVRLNTYLPILLSIGLLLMLATASAIKFTHMKVSTFHLLKNLTGPFWGLSWLGIAALALLTTQMPSVPFRRVFVYATPLYIGLIVVLAFGRIPYRFTFSDSANRMMIHVLPLIFFYFGLAFGPPLITEKRNVSTEMRQSWVEF